MEVTHKSTPTGSRFLDKLAMVKVLKSSCIPLFEEERRMKIEERKVSAFLFWPLHKRTSKLIGTFSLFTCNTVSHFCATGLFTVAPFSANKIHTYIHLY